MLEKFNKVDNPLTIIAIFAGITEVAASVALPFAHESTQLIFVWFLVCFPFALVAAFFITLNFNPRVLYAPTDYRDDKHFLTAMRLSDNTVSVTSADDSPLSIESLTRNVETPNTVSQKEEGSTETENKAVSVAVGHFFERAKRLFESDMINGYNIVMHGEGLFLLTIILKDKKVKGPITESRIIRATSHENGSVKVRVVGQNIECYDPEEFAELLVQNIEISIKNRKR